MDSQTALKRRYGYQEAGVSIIGNTLLFIMKYYYGLRAQSVALQADAFHTLSDVATSVVVLFGAWAMMIPADKEHPYGHGRWEQISTVVISVLLAVVGFNFVGAAYDKYINFTPVVFSWPVVIVFGISVLGKELMARWAFNLGKKAGSDMIIADSWHHRSDAIASALVIVPLFFGGQRWIDPLFGLAVAILILWVAWDLFRSSSGRLLGSVLSPEEMARVEQLAKEVSGVKSLHKMEVHDYVANRVITLHVEVDKSLTLSQGHEIGEQVEKHVSQSMGYKTIVHVEPEE